MAGVSRPSDPDDAPLPPPAVSADLLDQIHDGVVATDREGVVNAWNASAERIYGYRASEMIGQPVGRLYFPEDRDAAMQWVVAELRDHGVAEREWRSRRKDGSEIFVDLRISLRRDAGGQVIGTIGCTNDVTDRHRARAEEARQREELRVILDGMPAMVWYKDRHNNILRANAAAAAAAGLTPADMEGRSSWELFPDEAESYHRDDLEVIESGVPKLGIVEQIQTARGDKRWIRTDKIPDRNERGEIVGVIVFAVDIDDQKRAERALEQARDSLEQRVQQRTAGLAAANVLLRNEVAQRRQAEERLDLALRATELGMWDWDGRTGRVVGDTHWAEILGYVAREIERPSDFWVTITHPDDQAMVQQAWTAHVIEGTSPHYEVEHRLRAKSGEYRWLRTRGKVVERAPDGRALRVTGTYLDVTERRRIQEQAARHQAELAHILRLETVNCLAAELAHEINQPLGAIANYASGLAERLRNGVSDRAALVEAAAHIATQALRAGVVLQRLRVFMRKDASPRRSVDVNELVGSAVGLVEAEARRAAISLALDLAPDLPAARVDPVQVEQVIVNLLRNGLEVMTNAGARGALRVATRAAGRAVEVTVHDQGGGVPAAARERLFEPFFTTKSNGLGMGLSISRSIVEAHGGRLWVEPLAGDGATFAFTLPVD
ncbi:PAS domain S-box protein [bacterium]|nr:PAS domain S-box protein [bacterium]